MENSKIKPDMHAFMRELLEEIIDEKGISEESLRTWFGRKGAPGKKGGWVDCNAPKYKDGKKVGYKSCGRQKGEKRKYPACRPTPAGCKDRGKGKSWGKKSKIATEMKESKENWPETFSSANADEYEYRLKKELSDGRAKYDIIDLEKLTTYGTIIFDTVDDLKAHANDLIKPQGGRQSSHFGTNETADPQDGKAAPYGSGYGPVTKESIESLIREVVREYLSEKNVPTDKAKWNYYKSQAKKKFDTYPSAYANGWAAKEYKAAGGGWRKETKKSK